MSKVVILPLSLYMRNQQQKAEAQFKKLGVGSWSLFWQFLPLPKWLDSIRGPSLPALFDQYRGGELTTRAFRDGVRKKFPEASLQDKKFDDAWNAMQEVTARTLDAFKEAKELMAEGIDVYLLAGTNMLHIQDIKRKSKLRNLPGIPYFSFEKKKLGKDLFSQLLVDIRTQHPGIKPEEIAFFYTEPVDPQLSKFAWLYNPVKKYEYAQAKQYVSKLKKEAAGRNGFTLLKSRDLNDQKAHIKEAVAKLGWFDHKAEHKAQGDKPAITYSLRSHESQAKIGDIQFKADGQALSKRRANRQ